VREVAGSNPVVPTISQGFQSGTVEGPSVFS